MDTEEMGELTKKVEQLEVKLEKVQQQLDAKLDRITELLVSKFEQLDELLLRPGAPGAEAAIARIKGEK